MLEQLLQIVQQHGQQEVVNNPAIPNEYNKQVLGEAGSSIMNGLQQALAGGGLSQVMRMFNSGNAQGGGISNLLGNPVVQNIISSFTGKLTSQYNVQPQHAQQVGTNLISQVMQGLVGRANDPNDSSIDINGIMHSLTGGQAGNLNFQDLAKRFQGAGGDVDGDGDTDLQDIIASVSRGAGTASAGNGGGLMDLVQGFLK